MWLGEVTLSFRGSRLQDAGGGAGWGGMRTAWRWGRAAWRWKNIYLRGTGGGTGGGWLELAIHVCLRLSRQSGVASIRIYISDA